MRTFFSLKTRIFGFFLLVTSAVILPALWVALRHGGEGKFHQAAELAGVALLALALSFYLSRRFAKEILAPMEKLVKGTQYVVEGRYDERLDVAKEDEVGRLTESFNRMLRDLQDRERIRSVMDKMVSREIADELLKAGDLKLGGEIRFATILFSDIRDFTGLAESMDPQELISLLNDYLTQMNMIVRNNHGVIDKYIGDSIMSLFGAPITHANDVDNALLTGLQMLDTLKDFNARCQKTGRPEIHIGIGINTGPVVAGTMGSEDRNNYTVIGDTVNLASRLEGLTRIYNVDCVVSEFTQRECKKEYIFRELDMVRVKGRSTPVRVFELWNDSAAGPDMVAEVVQKFQNARHFYLLKDWARAENLFKQVLEMRPHDGPSALYLDRVQKLRVSPPQEAWDGVYTVSTK